MKRSLIPFDNQFGLMNEFRSEVDQLMNRFLTGSNRGELELSRWTPQLNLSETEKEYEVSVDLPGVKPEDVSVELKHGDLWITGERKSESEEKGKSWHRVERHHGQFRRMLRLGDDVDSLLNETLSGLDLSGHSLPRPK